MGLEIEELILHCEDRFGISIHLDDSNVTELETVGGFYVYIMRRLEEGRAVRCPRARAHFSLRAALARQLSVEKHAIQPQTALADLIPSRARRSIWWALHRTLPHPVPPLELAVSSRLIGGISILVGIPLVLLLGVGLIPQYESSYLWAAGILLCGLMVFFVPAVLFMLLESQLQRRLPAADFGELVDKTVAMASWGYGPEGRPWNHTTVWRELQAIVATQFGVDSTRIEPDTDFFKDLGAG